MLRRLAAGTFLFAAACSARSGAPGAPTGTPLGYSEAEYARAAPIEQRFRALVSSDSLSALHAPLARSPHVAGTPASLALADHLATTLRGMGLEVETHDYQAWLSLPRRVAVEIVSPTRRTLALEEPGADPAVGPGFIAYSGSGDVTREVVYVNYGLPPDYARLDSLGVDLRGKIALARYGRSHRAVKVHTAQQAGIAALILYSDPADDGFAKGAAWPDGYWRGEHLIQRGNAKMSWFWHGDPLTPGTPALAGSPRLDPKQAPTLPRIPVVALSWGEAQHLLASLGGPAAPADFAGRVPLEYRLGPGPVVARVAVTMDDALRPIRNVVATIRGATEPDRTVLFGTHHDAWTYGAVDPGTGAAALLETARSLAALARTGWQPRRSIAFGFWDAEEYGLVGSTEHVEQFLERDRRELVAYINTDMYMVGRFDPGGVPSLRDFVAEVARAVDDQTGTVYDGWRNAAWNRLPAAQRSADSATFAPALKALGSGADFVPFQDHLGVATLSLEFIGPNGYGFGTYHSSEDSRAYVERVADPGFRQGAVLSRLLGTVALRLGGAPVLPFRLSRYAESLEKALDDAGGWLASAGPALTLDLSPHAAAAADLLAATWRLEAAVDTALHVGSLTDPDQRRLNDGLFRFEQQLTDDDGDPDSKWFRHVVHGWNIYSLYDGQPFPGLYEAVRLRDQARADRESARILSALQRATRHITALIP